MRDGKIYNRVVRDIYLKYIYIYMFIFTDISTSGRMFFSFIFPVKILVSDFVSHDHPFGRPIPWAIWGDSWHALGFFFHGKPKNERHLLWWFGQGWKWGGEIFCWKNFWERFGSWRAIYHQFFPNIKFAGVVVGGCFLEFFFVLGRGEATKNWVFYCLNFWSWAIRDDFGWRKIHHFSWARGWEGSDWTAEIDRTLQIMCLHPVRSQKGSLDFYRSPIQQTHQRDCEFSVVHFDLKKPEMI